MPLYPKRLNGLYFLGTVGCLIGLMMQQPLLRGQLPRYGLQWIQPMVGYRRLRKRIIPKQPSL